MLAGLVRGDIRELRETGRRAYFQDVYDHINRVTDEIDTFRELTSNVIDAHLASVNNRLNEVVKVLTSVATVLLVLTLGHRLLRPELGSDPVRVDRAVLGVGRRDGHPGRRAPRSTSDARGGSSR